MNRHGIFRLTSTPSLSDVERVELDRHISEAEKKCGAEIVLSVIERCDAYPELPWKAFALGSSLAGLAVLIIHLFKSTWIFGTTILFAVGIILGAGAVCAFLSIFIPGFARLFLTKERAEGEARQYAESLFLSRELFSTRNRTGILLMVALFEHHVVVLPDTGLENRLNQSALDEMIRRMTRMLPSGHIADAMEEGLKALTEFLSSTASGLSKENELPNNVIEEEGQ